MKVLFSVKPRYPEDTPLVAPMTIGAKPQSVVSEVGVYYTGRWD